jgi:hypothetical protein
MRIKYLLPLIGALLVMPAMAYSLPGIVFSLSRTVSPAAASTVTVEAPVLPNDQFILKLPDGSAVSLTVTSCEGMGEGGFLDLDASNKTGFNDPKHIEIQVFGGNQGAGAYNAMGVTVLMGGADTPLFNGSTAAAEVTLAPDGSGSFKGVEINNTKGAIPYQTGKAYKFSGEWSCKR